MALVCDFQRIPIHELLEIPQSDPMTRCDPHLPQSGGLSRGKRTLAGQIFCTNLDSQWRGEVLRSLLLTIRLAEKLYIRAHDENLTARALKQAEAEAGANA